MYLWRDSIKPQIQWLISIPWILWHQEVAKLRNNISSAEDVDGIPGDVGRSPSCNLLKFEVVTSPSSKS